MATSIALSADGRVRRHGIPRHLRRRTETLIPVSLRLLDESGRHRIAEPMLGIAIEVTGYQLQVSVMGRSGRPLSYGLARRQKVVVSFLATELHEKVESLVCDLESVVPVSDQPDAWTVGLRLPALMPDLAEETISALHRYGRPARRSVSGWVTAGLVVASAVCAWMIASWSVYRDVEAQKGQTNRLRAQLAFSNQTVDQLALSLEEADRQLEVHRRTLADADDARVALAQLQASHAELVRRLERAQRKTNVTRSVHLRGVSLTDFRTVRSIRGAATAPRLVYRDGTLELINPAPEQRELARNAGRLLVAYGSLRSLPLKRSGSWSLESADGAIGLETEEAFVLGDRQTERPDFVIETRNPNAGEWLAAYAKVGVEEVWTYFNGRLEIRRLTADGYAVVPRSSLLPALDPSLLARFIPRNDQSAAVAAFKQALETTP